MTHGIVPKQCVRDFRTIGVMPMLEVHRLLLEALEMRALCVADRSDTIIMTVGKWGTDLIEFIAPLNEMGLGPDPCNIVMAHPSDGYDERNEELVIPRGADWHLFSGTSPLARPLAEMYGGRVIAGPLEVCQRAMLKSTLRRMIEELGLDLIPGASVATFDEARLGVMRLLEEYRDVNQIRFKPDDGASGDGHFRFTRGSDLAIAQTLVYPAVLEAELTDVTSHSVQWTIMGAPSDADAIQGPPVVIGEVADQIISGLGGFGGVVYPSRLPAEVTARAREQASRLATRYAHMGCRAEGGGDFLYHAASDKIYFHDPNLRYTATRFPIEVSWRLFGRVVPFVLRSTRVPRGTSVAMMRERLGRILYRRGSSEGVVPIAFLPRHQFAYFASFAQTPERARALDAILRDIFTDERV